MIARALTSLERFLLPNACIVCRSVMPPQDPDGLVCPVCSTRAWKGIALAKVTAPTAGHPAEARALAAASSVAPVVRTSSTRMAWCTREPEARIKVGASVAAKAPATFASRASGVNAVCVLVSRALWSTDAATGICERRPRL